MATSMKRSTLLISVVALMMLLLNASKMAAAHTTSPPDNEDFHVTSPQTPTADDNHGSGCEKGFFSCDDYFGPCIPREHVCDGKQDCFNGRDEENCAASEHDDLPSADEYEEIGWLKCKADEFDCGFGQSPKCIPLTKVCDKEKDCENGSDEGGMCDECSTHECSHGCQNYPDGPRCLCPDDMKLSVNELSCEYPNHCDEDKCSQFCLPSIEKLKCKCADGYDLEADGITCVPTTGNRSGRLFFSKDGNSIQSVELFSEGSAVKEVTKLDAPGHITSMAYDKQNGVLYYVVNSDHRVSEVWMVDVREGETDRVPKSMLRGHGVKHIAVDWVGGNLYYAADGIGIGVCSTDGKYCHHLIPVPLHKTGEFAQHYGDLIVHPQRGLLIWLEVDNTHPNGVIKVAGMDGQKVRSVGDLTSSTLRSISLDYVRDKLFSIESDGVMRAIDLHTLESKVDPMNMVNARTVMHFGSYRYFFDSSVGALMKRKTMDLMDAPTKLSDNVEIRDQLALTTDNELYYDKHMINSCERSGCSYLCVLKESALGQESQSQCLCPDRYSPDKDSRVCVYDHSERDGPVRTSSKRVIEMCESKEICASGQMCRGIWNDARTPACECDADYSGLYCEIMPPLSSTVHMPGSSAALPWILGLLFVALGIAVAYYCAWKYKPEWIDRLHDVFSGGSSFDPYRVAPFKGQAQKSQTGSTQSQDGSTVKAESKVTFTNPAYSQPIYPVAQLDV